METVKVYKFTDCMGSDDRTATICKDGNDYLVFDDDTPRQCIWEADTLEEAQKYARFIIGCIADKAPNDLEELEV